MLRYTGHPLVDTGIATLVAMAQKNGPEELTFEDLSAAADELRDLVFVETDPATGLLKRGRFAAFLHNFLFPNSAFTPPYKLPKDPAEASAKLAQELAQTLYAFQQTESLPGEECIFCSQPAFRRVSRARVPLLTGRFPNFGPAGAIGVPVCGICLLAVHALPLGATRVGGQLLMVVHGGSESLLLKLVRRTVKRNRTLFQQALLDDQQASQAGWPVVRFPRTRLVEILREVERANPGSVQGALSLITFTNNNQKADVRIDHLPSCVMEFLVEAEHASQPERRRAWEQAIKRGWPQEQEEGEREQIRNRLYEDLFRLPQQARRFFREHIRPVSSWPLTELYARKVLNMEKELLDLLRELGDRFAEYALRKKRSFYFEFGRARDYSTWRRTLLRAADDSARSGHGTVLITADEFVRAFTAPRDAQYFDWRLARDIVMLRMIEVMAQSGAAPSEEEELFSDEGEDTESGE